MCNFTNIFTDKNVLAKNLYRHLATKLFNTSNFILLMSIKILKVIFHHISVRDSGYIIENHLDIPYIQLLKMINTISSRLPMLISRITISNSPGPRYRPSLYTIRPALTSIKP